MAERSAEKRQIPVVPPIRRTTRHRHAITMSSKWSDVKLFRGSASRSQNRPTDQDARREDDQNGMEFDGYCLVDDEDATDILEPDESTYAPDRHEQPLQTIREKFRAVSSMLIHYFPQIKQPSSSTLSRHHSSASMSSVPRSQNGFAQSVGPGLGRSNSTIGRAQTSMSFHQSTNSRQRSNTSRARPQTAMHSRSSEEASTTGKKNCTMPPFAQSISDSLQYHKIRKVTSAQSIGSRPLAPVRDVSISTMMGSLSLNDERAYDGQFKRNQAILAKENLPPSLSLRPSRIQVDCDPFKQSQKKGSTDFLPQEEPRVCTMAPPKTPVSATDAGKLLDTFEETLLASTRKYTVSPTKSPSKVRPFLTKDSNMRTFTAWDMDERLIEVEAQFKVLKETMSGSLSEKKAMEEVIEMAKTRGMCSPRLGGSLTADTAKPMILNVNEID